MMMMTIDDAQELGAALLDAAAMMHATDVPTVSVEVYNGKAVAVQGGASDHTIILVIDTVPT